MTDTAQSTIIVAGDWLLDPAQHGVNCVYTEAYESREGQRWNGWAVPLVTRAVAERIAAWQSENGYDEGERLKWNGDVLILLSPDLDPQPVEPDADGLYLLDFGWCWDVVDADEAEALYRLDGSVTRRA